MRWTFSVLAILGLTFPAVAADLDGDFLRGSETVGPGTFTRWSGFYVGGQIGYSNGNADFTNATQPGLAYALRETTLENQFDVSQWQVLGTASSSAASFGGFLGYNTQWEDLVIGVEANLSYAGLNLNAPSTPIGPLTMAPDSLGVTHSVQINATGAITNLDFATLKARAGYVVGNFLPYGFVGPAFGLANVSVTANLRNVQSGSTNPSLNGLFLSSSSFTRNSEVLYGFTAGGGVDVALTPNIFVRAEFEYDQLYPPLGILLTVATGRVGAGVKF